MTRTYFGTDGIRGAVNEGVMTPALALKVGLAAGRHFRRGAHVHRVLIGKDTRRSGYMFEPALAAGFTAAGMDVIMVGPMPTPAIAMLVRSLRADLGVMISASHNPHSDNGLKFFGPDGYKLSDAEERKIEALMAQSESELLAPADRLGRADRMEDARGRYVEFAKAAVPGGVSFEGLKVVLDCAHGAAYRVAPTVLWELGAEVIPLAVSPDGFNINAGCGSTYPDNMCARVHAEGADLGIALDGDADRLILADERGEQVDGDQILALIARSWAAEGRLAGGGLVATVMSNLGLERALAADGLRLVRAPVGDRYVVEAMRAGGFNLGGEPSGHIVMSDVTTTGDGLIAALQVMTALRATGRPASEMCAQFRPVPQVLQSARLQPGGLAAAAVLDTAAVRQHIAAAKAALADTGRLLIRPSGTEPVIRVMAEADDRAKITALVAGLVDAIEAAA